MYFLQHNTISLCIIFPPPSSFLLLHPPFRLCLFSHQTQKNRARCATKYKTKNLISYESIIGGAAGNRLRVRKIFNLLFYAYSLSFLFIWRPQQKTKSSSVLLPESNRLFFASRPAVPYFMTIRTLIGSQRQTGLKL